jgi:hypothetical protein
MSRQRLAQRRAAWPGLQLPVNLNHLLRVRCWARRARCGHRRYRRPVTALRLARVTAPSCDERQKYAIKSYNLRLT